MSSPGEGLAGTWRNWSNDVAKFLKEKHGANFMIFNLTETPNAYDNDQFENQTQFFGFEDHHPPALRLMFQCCSAIYNWLSADKAHVAVVHCVV